MKITDSKMNLLLSVMLLIAALQCFLGHNHTAPLEGGGELPPQEKWQNIVGGIVFVIMSSILLFKK